MYKLIDIFVVRFPFSFYLWTQQDDADKSTSPEVSKQLTKVSSISLPTVPPMSLRKRLTSTNNSSQQRSTSPKEYSLVRDLDPFAPIPDPSKIRTNLKNSKLFPTKKNRSAEEFTFDRNSSRDSSECELNNSQLNWHKNYTFKNEERSQLICYKDNTKIIAIKNDSKFTKYNTFDMKSRDKNFKLTKYKSLDEPETKTLVKYLDKASNVSISADDFNSNFRLLKYGQRRPKHDIIVDTVDVWAKKGTKSVFSNIKKSIFKNNTQHMQKGVVFKPLVFGGTFPIDVPTDTFLTTSKSDEKPLDNDTVHVEKVNTPINRENLTRNKPISNKMKLREYGPAKSFDIDAPI